MRLWDRPQWTGLLGGVPRRRPGAPYSRPAPRRYSGAPIKHCGSDLGAPTTRTLPRSNTIGSMVIGQDVFDQAKDEREQRRWIRTLAIPFIAAAVFTVAALGGAGSAFIGAALVGGPGLGLAALLYLAFTSDTNGGAAVGERRHRVVVVGGGFAGLQAARGLRRAPVEVTLVDRQNYTLFQPLVYQVATGALSPAEIAMPLRAILRRQRNARVLLGEVTGFDLERGDVLLDRLPNAEGEARLAYDTLIVAGGSHYSYLCHSSWPK